MSNRSRPRWGIVGGGILAIIFILIASAYAYWQYVNLVPAYVPHLPPGPSPNGYLAAERAATSLQAVVPATPLPPPFNGRRPAATPQSRWPEGTPAEIRAHLARIQPLINQVRAQYRYGWSAAPDLLDPDLRVPFSGFRECARGFVAESILRREERDLAGAMPRALDAVELGARVSKGGPVIHRLVALAIHAIGFREAERLALQLPVSAVPASLSRVRRLRNEWPLLTQTLENERSFTRVAMNHAFQRYRRLSPIQQWRDLNPTGDLSAVETIRALLTPRRVAAAEIDDYYRRLIAESRKPVRQRRSISAKGDYWAELVSGIDPLDQPRMFERARTDLALLEVALAVRMHYLEHGRYPTRLSGISKQWLPAVPVDLWDQPIAYRLKQGMPVIYSLGPDGKDDGGLPVDPVGLTATTRGDLVFGALTRSRQRR